MTYIIYPRSLLSYQKPYILQLDGKSGNYGESDGDQMKKTVLIIDDDLDIMEVARFILSKEKDLQVLTSNNAAKGLELARQHKLDLILMDVMMPDLNGDEAMRLMKNQPTLKDIPVIFFTGLLSERDRHSNNLTILADGQRYAAIPKPFEADKLLTTVKSILGIQKVYEKHTNNI